MKIIFAKIRLKNRIGVDSLQLALSHLMDNEAEYASDIAMTPYEREALAHSLPSQALSLIS